MSYFLDIEIEGLPKRPNQMPGVQGIRRNIHKGMWMQKLWKAVWERKPQDQMHDARITLTRFASAPCDRDQLEGSFEIILECLNELGLMPINEVMPVYLIGKAGPNKGKIRIQIEEVVSGLEVKTETLTNKMKGENDTQQIG